MRADEVEVGMRFGRSVVLETGFRFPPSPSHANRGLMGPLGSLVRCDCGNERRVRNNRLVQGQSLSCGCLKAESSARNALLMAEVNTKHGMTGTPHYDRHKAILRRVLNPNDRAYKNYGGRGITIDPSWLDVRVFAAYLDENLGPCPEGSSLDRIDNDGPYAPGNVRWATAAEQQNNQRRQKS